MSERQQSCRRRRSSSSSSSPLACCAGQHAGRSCMHYPALPSRLVMPVMYVPLADYGHECAVKLHRPSRSMLHATVASSLGKNKLNPV